MSVIFKQECQRFTVFQLHKCEDFLLFKYVSMSGEIKQFATIFIINYFLDQPVNGLIFKIAENSKKKKMTHQFPKAQSLQCSFCLTISSESKNIQFNIK